MPAARTEVEAAYFALLRARDELSMLSRYEEYLQREAQRLRRGQGEVSALRDELSEPVRRALRSSDSDLAEVIERRLALIADELSRLPDRIAAVSTYVEECERTHALLSAGG